MNMKRSVTPHGHTTGKRDALTIAPLRLREVRQAHAVFVEALTYHFDYFDAKYKRTVLAENSLARMARATMRRWRVILVAKAGRRVVGYIIGSVPPGGNGQIYWLFVQPEYQGRNLGRELLRRMLSINPNIVRQN